MKKISAFFLIAYTCNCFATTDSLLTAQQFPKTFEDLSFKSKVEVLQDGYEPYAAEYDKNGFCVKNCAYPGLNIKQEEIIAQQDTEQALLESKQFEQQSIISTDDDTVIGENCEDRHPDIPAGQKVPRSEPLKGKPRITSKFGRRVLNGVQGFHDGIDYEAEIGTNVYAPAKGRVVAAGISGRCGKMVQIKHEDGTQTIYCHLSKIYVKKNQIIEAGCAFAETGNTGRTTGPHLHYAMINSQGNKINPALYTSRSGN